MLIIEKLFTYKCDNGFNENKSLPLLTILPTAVSEGCASDMRFPCSLIIFIRSLKYMQIFCDNLSKLQIKVANVVFSYDLCANILAQCVYVFIMSTYPTLIHLACDTRRFKRSNVAKATLYDP